MILVSAIVKAAFVITIYNPLFAPSSFRGLVKVVSKPVLPLSPLDIFLSHFGYISRLWKYFSPLDIYDILLVPLL